MKYPPGLNRARQLAIAAVAIVTMAACGDDPVADPCADVTCSGHGQCAEADGQAACTCDSGFAADALTCVNIDECADDDANDCDASATCTDTDGAYACACDDGYTGDGKTCADVDECGGVNDCDASATCANTVGSYTCACDDGYTGDGKTCANIDECDDDDANDCDANATCTDTDGSYTCACDDGYTGDGTDGTCVFDGDPCDPDADPNDTDCAFACIPVEAGDGVCADDCETAADCPAGWRCNLDYEEGDFGLCLPNASCGDLDLAGECDGTVLHFCDYEGPVAFDCATENDAKGTPKACRLASPDIGFDCVSASFTGGCGTVPTQGVCEGDTLKRCTSQAAGTVESTDCAATGDVCKIVEGHGECAPAGATGCGPITARGTCDGTTAHWCESFDVTSEDCADTGKICGESSDAFRCVAAPVASGAKTVTGRFLFEKRAATADGLGAISNQPVRAALVTVRLSSDESMLAQGYTDQNGTYALQFEATADVYVLVVAQGEHGKHNHTVYDCPLLDCGGDANSGNKYGATTADFTPDATNALGDTVITVAGGNAGAFNIFDVFVKGADFAKANMGSYPPVVSVLWKAGSSTPIDTSYFAGEEGRIFVLGTPADTDEFDDAVLLHEYGHYLEFYLSRSDSPGGSHDGSPTDPRLAFGEGYGTYVGCAVSGSPIYIDTDGSSASVTDARIAADGLHPSANSPRGMRQLVSEFFVLQALYTIAEGPGGANGKTHAPTFDVLSRYFRYGTPPAGRGVDGLDMVDFLDGWFCREHGDRPYIEGIINTTLTFPYDYRGPATCPSNP